jgi:hypothetical protein
MYFLDGQVFLGHVFRVAKCPLMTQADINLRIGHFSVIL